MAANAIHALTESAFVPKVSDKTLDSSTAPLAIVVTILELENCRKRCCEMRVLTPRCDTSLRGL